VNILEKYAAKQLLIEKLAYMPFIRGGVAVARGVRAGGRATANIAGRVRKGIRANPLDTVAGTTYAGGLPYLWKRKKERAARENSPAGLAAAKQRQARHLTDRYLSGQQAATWYTPKAGSRRATAMTSQSIRKARARGIGGHLDFHTRQSVPFRRPPKTRSGV
jgi:hypothetical protein